jgi:hypothetical protein
MPFAEYYFSALLVAAPVLWIFIHAGFRPFWTLLLAIPEVGLIACLLFLALRKWPAQQAGRA